MGEENKQENVKEETKVEEKKEEKVDETKGEETKEEKAEEKKEEEEAKPPAPCVLFVDLHCMGCAKKIERSISKIRGVEGVVIDMAKNEVTIKGMVEPQAVCNKIMARIKRNAKVLSPLPEAEGEPIPQIVASQVSGLTTVELNVNMHCEACAQQLKRMILKMKGVSTAETEFSSSKVSVTGTMDAEQLVDYVYRRTKKQAKIVPQPEPEKPPEESPKPEEKKEEGKGSEEAKPDEKKDASPPPEEEKKEGENAAEQGGETKEEVKNGEEQIMQHRMMYQYNYQPLYMIERIPPPQLFSDENPNACSVM